MEQVSVLKTWMRVSDILGEDMKKKAWLTSKDWAILCFEVNNLDGVDPDKPVPVASRKNFNKVRIGSNLTLHNSGTEDQEVVDLLNWREMGTDYEKFRFRASVLQTGKLAGAEEKFA